jgi:glycyl-tRNA synthetase
MDFMEKLVSLSKRRGFIFPSSEIYGGLNGCWDYGPLGVELKRNLKEAWWQDMVVRHDDTQSLPGAPSEFSMVGLDCSILMNPKVWVASGHVSGFSDPLVDCKECKARFREDQIWLVEAVAGSSRAIWKAVLGSSADEALAPFVESAKEGQRAAKKLGADAVAFEARAFAERDKNVSVPCPACGKEGTLTEPRAFNLMFETHVGALKDSSSIAYLRPETAQGIFVNFKNVCDTVRVRPPFGIAQIGKAFRNEINPRNFTFRSREFEQMEIEFFCPAEQSMLWYHYWRDRRFQWYVKLGLQSSKLRLREHDPKELAHYASGCADVEYDFPFGISELEGIANRGGFDLTQHMQHS